MPSSERIRPIRATTPRSRPVTSVLALHDGRAGNARQALALAHALDADGGELALRPGLFAGWLAPRKWPFLSAPFGPAFRAECETPPAIAIGCGRQAALATRLLREHGSRTVQILDPRIDTRHWDLVIAPRHDGLLGSNVLATLGSLNPVDDAWLLRARAAFPALAALPAPHTVLLLGGPTRHAPLRDGEVARLLHTLSERARAEGGSFSAIASRRTPPAWLAAMGQVDHWIPGTRWRDTGDGANPYAGLLAHASRIVCTSDSVNMLSEAAATPAPVFVWRPEATSGRVRAFIESLQDSGRVRMLDDAMAPFTCTPLRETARIAALVRKRLAP